jgi:hypothetical protein
MELQSLMATTVAAMAMLAMAMAMAMAMLAMAVLAMLVLAMAMLAMAMAMAMAVISTDSTIVTTMADSTPHPQMKSRPACLPSHPHTYRQPKESLRSVTLVASV